MCSSINDLTRWRISLISGVSVKSGTACLLSCPPCYGAVSSRNAARLILERSAASSETGTMFTIGRVTPFRRYASIFSRTPRPSPNPSPAAPAWGGAELERFLAVAGLPGLRHRPQRLAPAEPAVEGGVDRRGQVGGDHEPRQAARRLLVVRGNDEDA